MVCLFCRWMSGAASLFFLVKTRTSVNMGKLVVGSNSALAGAVKANGLLHFRCLSCPICGWTHGIFCPAAPLHPSCVDEEKATSQGSILP